MFTRSPVKNTASGCRELIHSARRARSCSGPDDRAHVDVADLHEPVTVERLGNAVGADFDFAHADRSAAPRRTPEEEEREARGDGITRAAQVQEIEDVERQARQYGDDPSPEQPHIKIHQSRAVVGAEDVDDRRNERQGIRRGGPCDQGLAPRNMPVPVAPEMDENPQQWLSGRGRNIDRKSIYLNIFIRGQRYA